METIYSFLKLGKKKKGIVEFISTYDNSHFIFAVDGKQVVDTGYTRDFDKSVSLHMDKLVKESGVQEDQLTFVYFDFGEYLDFIVENNPNEEHVTGYDYDYVLDFVKRHPNVSGDDIEVMPYTAEDFRSE